MNRRIICAISSVASVVTSLAMPLSALSADEMIVRRLSCKNGAKATFLENFQKPEKKGFGESDQIIHAAIPNDSDVAREAGFVARVKKQTRPGGNFGGLTVNFLFKGPKEVARFVEVKAFFRLNRASHFGPAGTIVERTENLAFHIQSVITPGEWNEAYITARNFGVLDFFPDVLKVAVYLKAKNEAPRDIYFGDLVIHGFGPLRATTLKMEEAGCNALDPPKDGDDPDKD